MQSSVRWRNFLRATSRDGPPFNDLQRAAAPRFIFVAASGAMLASLAFAQCVLFNCRPGSRPGAEPLDSAGVPRAWGPPPAIGWGRVRAHETRVSGARWRRSLGAG